MMGWTPRLTEVINVRISHIVGFATVQLILTALRASMSEEIRCLFDNFCLLTYWTDSPNSKHKEGEI